jgi:cytidine deaminase
MTEKVTYMINTEEKMFQEAVNLINARYPKGWGGAGVVRTENDHYYTSVWLDTINSSVTLCIETGAMCEAHKYNERVTHCLCVVREDENSKYKVLSPCGVCQERLRYWGDTVMVGVSSDSTEIVFVSLKELQPYHWTSAYSKDKIEDFQYINNHN